jgi:hypothetical protein
MFYTGSLLLGLGRSLKALLFFGVDVPGILDGAQETPAQIGCCETSDAAKDGNAAERRRRLHAPQQSGSEDQRGRDHAEHEAVYDRIEMVEVKMDGECSVAQASEDIAQITWKSFRETFPVAIGVLEAAENAFGRETPADH